MNAKGRTIAIAFIATGAVVAGVAAARLTSDGPGVHVTTATVTRGPIEREVFATGTLQPERSVQVGSQVSGTIVSLEADFNSEVRAGQVVARIDPAPYHAQLIEAQARLGQATGEELRQQTALEDARRKLERAEELAARDLIPATQLEEARLAAAQAEADLRAARAAIVAAKAAIARAEVDLEHTIIRSPVDGIVIARHVEVGQTLAARLEAPVLFTIADLTRMQLMTEVGEGDVGGVQPGTTVTFQVESLRDTSFQGRVSDVRLMPVFANASSSGSSGGSNRGAAATPVATSGSSSSSRTTGGTTSTTGTSSTTTSQSTTPQPVAGSVVSYTAVVDVPNPDRRLVPGSTALVTLGGARRDNAIRIPNNALTFAPNVDLLRAVRQQQPRIPRDPSKTDLPAGLRRAVVWKFENNRFVPVPVTIGLADEEWTELVEGEVAPDDQLVVRAVPRR